MSIQHEMARDGPTVKNHPPIQESIENLPNFFYGKSVELIDKTAMLSVYIAFAISQGMEAAFSDKYDTTATKVQLSLKNSKEFKEWHRTVEDFIDDTIKQSRKLMKMFSEVVYGVTNKEKLRDYVAVVQSFDFFKDRVDLAFQMERMSLTAWGLKELSKLLDKARGSKSPPRQYKLNQYMARDGGRSASSRSWRPDSLSAFEFIDDGERSGMFPHLKGHKGARKGNRIRSEKSFDSHDDRHMETGSQKERALLRSKVSFGGGEPVKAVREIAVEGDHGSRPYEFATYPILELATEGDYAIRKTDTIKKTKDNLLVPLFSNDPELVPRKPVMMSEPRHSMSQLTVKSRPMTADPVIYPHILQQDSSLI